MRAAAAAALWTLAEVEGCSAIPSPTLTLTLSLSLTLTLIPSLSLPLTLALAQVETTLQRMPIAQLVPCLICAARSLPGEAPGERLPLP